MSLRCRKCAWPLRNAEVSESMSCHEHRCIGLCDRCRIECLKRVKQSRIYQDWSDQHYQSKEKKMPKKSDPLARLGARIRSLAGIESSQEQAAYAAETERMFPKQSESDGYVARITDTLNLDRPEEISASLRRIDAQLRRQPQLYAIVFESLQAQGIVSLERWRDLVGVPPDPVLAQVEGLESELAQKP